MARTITVWRQSRPAASTSRLKPSLSDVSVVRPRKRPARNAGLRVAGRACGRRRGVPPDPGSRTASSWPVATHAIRPFVQDSQVEILEQRQHVGHRAGLAAAVQAQVQCAAAWIAGAQLHAKRVGRRRQRCKLFDVGERLTGGTSSWYATGNASRTGPSALPPRRLHGWRRAPHAAGPPRCAARP